MKYFVIIFVTHVLISASACPDPITNVHIQNHDGPIYLSPTDRLLTDNQITIGNRSPTDFYGTCGNHSPTCTTCGNQLPTYATSCNQCPTYTSVNQPPLLHNCNHPNYHTICETDCKCVTKQLNTCVPINTIPQNTCTPSTYYGNDYGNYGYGYLCPEQYGSEGSCPISTEGLIPLLKSYIGQSKCPKHCKCGQCYNC